MQSFTGQLDDREFASLVNFVRGQFGSGSTNATEHDVASLRRGGTAPILPLLIAGWIAAAILIAGAAVLLICLARCRRRLRHAG